METMAAWSVSADSPLKIMELTSDSLLLPGVLVRNSTLEFLVHEMALETYPIAASGSRRYQYVKRPGCEMQRTFVAEVGRTGFRFSLLFLPFSLDGCHEPLFLALFGLLEFRCGGSVDAERRNVALDAHRSAAPQHKRQLVTLRKGSLRAAKTNASGNGMAKTMVGFASGSKEGSLGSRASRFG